mmetsp:Transcript_40510/g.128248  ORF Transcript_40510/g.128248 Transcript_40510/m.128248 type:complete len:235 (-) Transcript_40510:2-706(-)
MLPSVQAPALQVQHGRQIKRVQVQASAWRRPCHAPSLAATAARHPHLRAATLPRKAQAPAAQPYSPARPIYPHWASPPRRQQPRSPAAGTAGRSRSAAAHRPSRAGRRCCQRSSRRTRPGPAAAPPGRCRSPWAAAAGAAGSSAQLGWPPTTPPPRPSGGFQARAWPGGPRTEHRCSAAMPPWPPSGPQQSRRCPVRKRRPRGSLQWAGSSGPRTTTSPSGAWAAVPAEGANLA